MIVSASRRTDIPAFYSRWLINRLRAGYCEVKNPFNTEQITRVDLRPEAVTAIVFWTRDPRPLLPHLGAIRAMGHQPFFLVTCLDNPRTIDPKCPGPETSLSTLAALAETCPGRITWRYDPIVLSALTPPDWHRRTFERLAKALEGVVDRVTVSFMEPYRKISRRLAALAEQGIVVTPPDPTTAVALLTDLQALAATRGMALTTCSQPEGFAAAGIPAGRCIDPVWIGRTIGVPIPSARDSHQRPRCGCAPSKDIGAYDTCLFGCTYCYASRNFDRARAAYARHDPMAASLG